jgi:uroporphyrinogen decarboxylase
MALSNRERFLATINFQKLDRPFRLETIGFWNETLARWKHEGLPAEYANPATAFLYFGVDLLIPIVLGADQHPGFDPLFNEEIIKETDRTIIKRDFTGCIVEVFKDGSSALPRFLDFPVKDRKSWEEVKKRLDPTSPNRLGAQWEPLIALAKTTSSPLILTCCGLFGTLRHLMGFEALMLAYYDQPELIHDISQHWAMLWKETVIKAHSKHPLDGVFLWEDMCGKNGPFISPRLFREFMSPYYKELLSFFRDELKIPCRGVDSDGNVTALLPLFVEAGVNFLFPFEVQAGMDVVQVRKDFPHEFTIWGGIDKRALAKGEKAIEEEIERILPFMLKHGGYISAIDHTVPPDVSLDNFKFFLERVRKRGEEICAS